MNSTSASLPTAAPWLAHLRREAERFVHRAAVWKRAVPPRPELDVTGSAVVLKRFLATDYIPDPRTTPAH